MFNRHFREQKSSFLTFILLLTGNRREVLQTQYSNANGEHFVGLTGDQDGCLYTSLYGSSKLIKIDPKYVPKRKQSFPALDISLIKSFLVL